MDALLNQDGVKYVGAVNHSELRAALRSAGFILYPTTFQETGCITVMKAMQAGCVPITSRLYDSVLRNLTAPFDLGPQVGLHSSVQRDASARDAWLRDQWVPAVIAAASADETQMQSLRVAMMQHARETFSWSSTAKIFTQQLQH
jgi:glycosyltransferase involved in cell wall biosynthesis